MGPGDQAYDEWVSMMGGRPQWSSSGPSTMSSFGDGRYTRDRYDQFNENDFLNLSQDQPDVVDTQSGGRGGDGGRETLFQIHGGGVGPGSPPPGAGLDDTGRRNRAVQSLRSRGLLREADIVNQFGIDEARRQGIRVDDEDSYSNPQYQMQQTIIQSEQSKRQWEDQKKATRAFQATQAASNPYFRFR
jgi:hypothetical protein